MQRFAPIRNAQSAMFEHSPTGHAHGPGPVESESPAVVRISTHGDMLRWIPAQVAADIVRAQVALASGDSPAAKAPPPTLPGQAQNVSNKRQPQINPELAAPPPKVGRPDNYSPQASSPISRVTTNAVPVPQNAPTAHGPIPQNDGPWPKAHFANFRRRVPVMTNEEESGFE